ncbi:FAD-dependent oxidoreductase [Henriciella aquimarina]|uniref:FAD-dependent oxidoreductase n=1 Tax=Henriciella aquimarina TaxID=545261 RepID=UPI001301B943|nr:FAD-dependent oxidoreductase [Henriciella aquimarina]
MSEKSTAQHIAVIGGGVIGLACACELVRRGHRLSIFDTGSPRQSASWAAAGMIAPAYELMLDGGGPETPLSRLCFESATLWGDFAAYLKRETGLPVGYDDQETYALARTAAELEKLEALEQWLSQAGHAVRWLTPAELYERAGLSPDVLGGLSLPEDHQVDNRRLLGVMRRFLGQAGAVFVNARIDRAEQLKDHEGERPFDRVVWARGVDETEVETPVKGQALALFPLPHGPERVLRFGSGYIVPKPDRIVIGATSEKNFSHEGASPEEAERLFAAARAVLPALNQARIMEHWAGLRPMRTGGLPLIGARPDGSFVAAAHYRNGVLLAPATARRIADLVEGAPHAPDATDFAPSPASGATA